MTRLLLCIVGFLLPFELGIAEAAHGLLQGALGSYYRLAFLGYWGTAVLALIFYGKSQSRRPSSWLFPIAGIFTLAGLWEWIATLCVRGPTVEAERQFMLGFLFPALLFVVISMCHHGTQLAFFRSWYTGMLAMMLVSFLVLAATYDRLPPWFLSLPLASKLIAFRYSFAVDGYSNYYMAMTGNFNKFSNYLLMMLLFSCRLLEWDGKRRGQQRLFFAFWLTAVVTLVVMFSRLALMLLPLVTWGSGVIAGFSRKVRVRLYVASSFAAVAFVALFFDQIRPTAEYLAYSKYLDSQSEGVLGTGYDRFTQWAALGPLLSNSSVWLHGLGTTTYGELRGDPNLGTHNLFLDHLLASGILVPASILFMMGLGALRAYQRRDRMPLVALSVMFMLMIREHSFSYLYVTSLGGVVFMAIFYVQGLPYGNREANRGNGGPLGTPAGQ